MKRFIYICGGRTRKCDPDAANRVGSRKRDDRNGRARCTFTPRVFIHAHGNCGKTILRVRTAKRSSGCTNERAVGENSPSLTDSITRIAARSVSRRNPPPSSLKSRLNFASARSFPFIRNVLKLFSNSSLRQRRFYSAAVRRGTRKPRAS